MKVNVREADVVDQQIAVGEVDVDTTLTNLPVNIAVLANDTVTNVTQLYVSRQPAHGMAIKQDNNTITYTPFNEYCNETTPDNFEYVVCNAVGCDSVQVFVWVLCDKLKVFTGFSPNNDAMNDFFYIEGLPNFPNNKVTIYNRWGNLVYNKEKYDNTWDGTWKNNPLPDGTYFWIFDDGEGKTYSGYVELRR
jgi:gliding motility-associated-like protein